MATERRAAVIPELKIERDAVIADSPGFDGPAPQSDIGLTPGAPGGEGWNGGKVVAD